MASDDQIDVRKYDAAVRALGRGEPEQFQLAVLKSGLSMSTVKKIWDGTISRPPVVVLKRLRKPRRCPACGARCRDWPCITCTMRRRRERDPEVAPRFVYASGSK